MSFFKNIALALSGGGYRAATYHFGVLSCLHKVGLLDKVSIISSVSGGSITTLKYASTLAEGLDFEIFSKELEEFLTERNLANDSIGLLGAPTSKRILQKHTLITAFSELYHRYLFSKESKKFNIFWNSNFKNCHIKELAINATEFYSGNSFRFTKSQSKGAIIGNKHLRIYSSDAQKLRLGDILAASSCFPAGFEPIDLLNDFAISKPLDRDYKNQWQIESLYLMDGGIYDNQGLEAIKLSIDRGNWYDMIIISDTDRDKEYPLYAPSNNSIKLPKWTLKKTLSFILRLLILIYFLIVIGASTILSLFLPLDLIIGSFLLISIGLFSGLKQTQKIIKQHINRKLTEQFGRPVDLEKLSLLKVFSIIDSIYIRAQSLVSLTNTIFMKRIRGLVYNSTYKAPGLARRTVDNLIYSINDTAIIDGFQITNLMIKKVSTAKSMPTTLWFTDENQFNALKDTGEFTTAYKLIKHIDKISIRLGKNKRKELDQIRNKLFMIWLTHCKQ